MSRKILWYERLMAAIAVANLGFVGFDMTYVGLRDFWLRGGVSVGPVSFQVPVPPIPQWYDPIKGIEPHRDTEQYLKSVQDLEASLFQSGLDSPKVDEALKVMQDESAKMIEGNWFEVAGKSGNLEKIKNRMRDRMGVKSSRQSFEAFWSKDYLKSKGVESELRFFNEKVKPLLLTNYYRTTGENGLPTDNFWMLDAPFMALFGLEFLARTFYLTRRNRNLKWLDAMLWRWYDILLLIPLWQWLRVIPVAIRLDQAELIHLDRIRDQATQGFVTNISEELTEAVLVQVIDQLQSGISTGSLTQWAMNSLNRPYQDINQRDEIREIITRILDVTVNQALPQVKPELEAVIRHAMEGVLEQSPVYKGFKSIPLMGSVPSQMNEQLISSVTSGAYEALSKALEDEQAAELISTLVRSLGSAMVQGLQEGNSLDELQSLLADLMEEVKVNYIKHDSQAEKVSTVETEALRLNTAGATDPNLRSSV
jgi:hypothetical protein